MQVKIYISTLGLHILTSPNKKPDHSILLSLTYFNIYVESIRNND